LLLITEQDFSIPIGPKISTSKTDFQHKAFLWLACPCHYNIKSCWQSETDMTKSFYSVISVDYSVIFSINRAKKAIL
jgi:hypothetical protein